jgi:glutathione reductase (NADPH)
MTHNFDYDYFVIGGGSGGVRSARIAASHGAKVGIAEGKYWGGTCVNVGCVPKKLFTYAADYGSTFKEAEGYGWSVKGASFNWQTLLKNKNKEIERLNQIYAGLLGNAGVTSYEEYASFKDEHTILVNGEEITSEKFLIAVGGIPRHPIYEGAEHTINSDQVFYIDKLPEHIVIEGGGYVAVEFAHIFHGLGCKVTITYRKDVMVRDFDHDIAEFLTDEMKKQEIDFHLQTNIQKVEKGDRLSVTLDKGEIIECDMVLSAIGRVPNIEKLDLKKTAVETLADGRIKINEHYQTSVEHIYAVGDVTNKIQLTPVAIAEGHILADRLFKKGDERQANFDNIPTAVFSNPEIGTVGLSEKQALDKGHDIEIFKIIFKPMRHTLSGRDEKTMMKLIIDKKTDKVLGAHMCGADAAEMMQGIAVAIQCGATKADFDRTIGIHPTSAEEWVTMR